jgi:hypothetical protein
MSVFDSVFDTVRFWRMGFISSISPTGIVNDMNLQSSPLVEWFDLYISRYFLTSKSRTIPVKPEVFG